MVDQSILRIFVVAAWGVVRARVWASESLVGAFQCPIFQRFTLVFIAFPCFVVYKINTYKDALLANFFP